MLQVSVCPALRTLAAHNPTIKTISLPGTYKSDHDWSIVSTMATTLQELLSAYYYRRVQIETAVHVCRLGYCRDNYKDPCLTILQASRSITCQYSAYRSEFSALRTDALH